MSKPTLRIQVIEMEKGANQAELPETQDQIPACGTQNTTFYPSSDGADESLIPQHLPHSEVSLNFSSPEKHMLYSHNRSFFIRKTASTQASPRQQTSKVQRWEKTPREEHLQWNLRESKEFQEMESREKKRAVLGLDSEVKQTFLL